MRSRVLSHRPALQFAFSEGGHRRAVVQSRGTEVTIYEATSLPEQP